MAVNLSDILSKAAPWLAAAAAGPAGLAGMAIKTVATALGSSAETSEEMAAAIVGATPEQMAAVRVAEMDFQARMQDLGFKQVSDLEAMASADRKDARAMQVANKSFMPALLSSIIVVGYLAVLVGMLRGWLKTDDSQALLIMLGSLGTGFGIVLSFWFGTTRQSEDKTRMLAASEPVK